MKSLSVLSSILFGSILVSSAVGCASSDPPGSSGSEDNLTVAKPKPGTEGGECGGLLGLTCEEDLDCKLTAQHPDAAGICVKRTTPDGPSEEGEFCGGIGNIRCKDGLECIGGASHPDSGGTCAKKAAPRPGEEGGECGGFAGFTCQGDLHCRGNFSHPDAMGICTK